MTILERINNFFRGNTNPSPVIDEALYSEGVAYVDPLVFRGYNNFLNKIDKRASMYQDPILNTLTLGWASVATTKTFKFYDSHEVTGQEIMQEYRAWWMANNLDELLKSMIPHLCMDGWVLVSLWQNKDETLDYEIYGSYECDTIHWKRDEDNKILHYNVKFIPFPSPHGWAYGSSYCKAVDKEYDVGELLHFTRGDWNYGVGRSRIAPAWDPAIKLRIGSYADFFRRDLRFIVAVPEGWKKNRVKKFADSFNDMMRGSRRMFIYKMEQSKDPSKTPLELPRFGLESLARAAPKPMSQSEAGGELLRDPEWARLLSAVRLTENYFIGNQAGAVTGSEVDLTRDFYTECEEFGLYEPVIKQLINLFVMMGLIPPPPSDYVVKYWKDWEHIEKAAQMMEQEMQQWEQKQGQMVAGETRRKELRQQSAMIENATFDIDKPGRWITKGGKHIYIPFKERELILDYMEDEEGQPQYLVSLYSHPTEETLYAQIQGFEEEPEIIELATHVNHMIKIKKWLEKRIEKILGTPEQVEKYEEELFQYKKANAMLNIELYRHNKKVNEYVLYCLRNNVDFPATPVSSTWISHVGVKDRRLWVKIPGWKKGPWAGFEFSSEEIAGMKGREMLSSDSRGAYMWDNIWTGGGPGPRPTAPGINEEVTGIHYKSSPFEEIQTIGETETFEERREGLLQPPEGFIGTEGTRRPLIQKEAPSTTIPSYTPFEETSRAFPTSTQETSYFTSGYEYNPQSITGATKTGAGAKRSRGRSTTRPSVIPYNPTISLKNTAPKLNSQAYIKKMADKLDWNMSNSTAQKIMALVNLNEEYNKPRYNSFVIGNVMDFDILLRYPDNPKGEKACPKAWRKINAHEGDLYVYDDLGHGGKRHNVGTYKYWWDNKNNKNVIVYNKEEVFEKVEKLLNQWGVKDSEIQMKINNGMAPDLSTEYYCSMEERDGVKYQVNFHNRYGDPVFEGIAIVEKGNCSYPACGYEIVEEVI